MKPLGFDSVCLAAVVVEAQSLVHGRIQKIVQPDERSLALGIYARGQEQWLLLSADRQFARAHLISKRPEGITPAPETCTLFRRLLLDGQVIFVRQRGLDRILEIGVSAKEGDFQIVAELHGRHANVIAVDSARKCAAALEWVGTSKSRRPITPGRTYAPPPFDPRPPLTEAKPDDDLSQFEGFSPSLKRLMTEGLELETVQQALKTGKFDPHQQPDVGAYPFPFGHATPVRSFSLALERHFEHAQDRAKMQSLAASLRGPLERVLLARERALADVDEALDTARRARDLQMQAELILAYQHQIEPGQATLETIDYEGQPISIKLNPEKTALENANRLFDKTRRAKNRADEVRGQRERLAEDANRIREMLEKIETADSAQQLVEMKAEADARKWLHKQHSPTATAEEKPFEGHSIREVLSPSGYKVLYGLNATSNDYLTSRVARPNDWWLHVRGAVSAHVVLISNGQPDRVPHQDIVFAADIAKRNSVQKHSSYVPVDYTLKKHVRKPRKSAPGLAVYEREKTVYID